MSEASIGADSQSAQKVLKFLQSLDTIEVTNEPLLQEGENCFIAIHRIPDTTPDGVLEALFSGDLKADELMEMAEEQPELFGIQIKKGTDPTAIAALKQYGELAQQEQVDDSTCPTPGARRKSKGRGRGLARGRGRGPIGVPPRAGTRKRPRRPGAGGRGPGRGLMGVEPGLEAVGSFESLVDEACRRPTKKESLDEGIHEFAAPERQDIIRWARGDAPQRDHERMPFYFEENFMFSRKKKIAERNPEAKTAKVLTPKVLDAQSGRHAVLAEKGLRYAGFEVELVNSLE